MTENEIGKQVEDAADKEERISRQAAKTQSNSIGKKKRRRVELTKPQRGQAAKLYFGQNTSKEASV